MVKSGGTRGPFGPETNRTSIHGNIHKLCRLDISACSLVARISKLTRPYCRHATVISPCNSTGHMPSTTHFLFFQGVQRGLAASGLRSARSCAPSRCPLPRAATRPAASSHLGATSLSSSCSPFASSPASSGLSLPNIAARAGSAFRNNGARAMATVGRVAPCRACRSCGNLV